MVNVSAASRTRRLAGLALAGILGFAVQAWADPDRCYNCGYCSSSDFACGLCVVEAVQSYCDGWGPDAYCTCANNQWDCFCDRIDR